MNKLTKNQIKYKRKKIKDKLRKNNNNRCPNCRSGFNLQLSYIEQELRMKIESPENYKKRMGIEEFTK